MEATQIFPALLAFMITVLSALGYALHRLSDTPQQNTFPPISDQRCAYCGERRDARGSHCPVCGTSGRPRSMLSGLIQEDGDDTIPGGSARQS